MRRILEGFEARNRRSFICVNISGKIYKGLSFTECLHKFKKMEQSIIKFFYIKMSHSTFIIFDTFDSTTKSEPFGSFFAHQHTHVRYKYNVDLLDVLDHSNF